MNIEEIKSCFRTVKDFPVKGILFYDITTMLKNPEALRSVSDILYETYKDKGITKVVGLESRGFILGADLAIRIGAGFVPIRKPGKLPAAKLSQSYNKEYGVDTIELHQDAISEDDIVLMHDDLLATGGSAVAALSLIERANPKKIFANFIVELEALGGRKLLGDIETVSIVKF
jgi:hypothetical protein